MNLIATEIPSACAFAAVAVIALCTHSILTAPCVPFGLIAKLRLSIHDIAMSVHGIISGKQLYDSKTKHNGG